MGLRLSASTSSLLVAALVLHAGSAGAVPIELGPAIDVGAQLTTNVQAPADADEGRSDFAVAAHGDTTLVVWVEDGADLYAAIVATDGAVGAPTKVHSGSAQLYSVRATYAEGHYRVAVGDRQGIYGFVTIVSLDEGGALVDTVSYGPPAGDECTPSSIDGRGASLVIACAGAATITVPADGAGAAESLLSVRGSPHTEVSCHDDRCVAGFLELDASQTKNVALVTLGERRADLERTYLGLSDATPARIAVAATSTGAMVVSRSLLFPSGAAEGEAIDHIDGYFVGTDGTMQAHPSLVRSSTEELLDARIASNGRSVALTYRVLDGASSIVALDLDGAPRGAAIVISSEASKDLRLAAAGGGHYVVAYDQGGSLFVRTARLDAGSAPEDPTGSSSGAAAPDGEGAPEGDGESQGEGSGGRANESLAGESGCSMARSAPGAPGGLAVLVALLFLGRRRSRYVAA